MVNYSTNLSPLRIAVVGAGVMGNHHLRICSLLKSLDLIGVMDVDPQKADAYARQYQCQAFTTKEALLGKVDAVIIAAPTEHHLSLGTFFLSNGVHCLIEKPLATTEEDCIKLIQLAEKNRLILSVGHTEHYNPAVLELKKLLKGGHHIRAIHAQRLSQANRSSDIDVVMDLMVHDLEVIQSIMTVPVIKTSAYSVSSKNNLSNHVAAVLFYADGAIANVIASRVTPARFRQLCITTDKAYIVLDYQTQEITVSSQVPASDKTNNRVQMTQKIPVAASEPLLIELQHFVKSIREGQVFGVDGRQALAALKLVFSLQNEINVNAQKTKNWVTENTENTVL